MGDMFSSKSSSQSTSTANQQVGVQGGIGQSGTVSGSQSAGGVAVGNTGGNLTIQTLDAGAIHEAATIAAASAGGNRDVSIAAINASQQLGLSALETLSSNQTKANNLALDAVHAASNIALTATPASANETLQSFSAGSEKQLFIIGASLVALFATYKLIK